MTQDRPELLLLHALPLDGSMWAAQMELLPKATYAPTLYGLGETVEEWAAEALKLTSGNRLIVVGCSVGGSCALEAAVAATERVAAIVLIGTKASHRPDPELHSFALATLQEKGVEAAWDIFWEPLFSPRASDFTVERAKLMAMRQSPSEIARGVSAFHRRPSRDSFLSTAACPLIVVTGEDDSAPGLTTSALQAASAPNGRLHIIPGCGHYVPLEQPKLLNSILRDVIAEVEKASGSAKGR